MGPFLYPDKICFKQKVFSSMTEKKQNDYFIYLRPLPLVQPVAGVQLQKADEGWWGIIHYDASGGRDAAAAELSHKYDYDK